jgi:hypothetical protein
MNRRNRFLLLLLLAAMCGGCTLLSPSERTIDEAMSPSAAGQVSRDQYGNWILTDRPQPFQQRAAVQDAARILTGV